MPESVLRWVVGTPEQHSLSWKVRVQRQEIGAEVYVMPREISNDYHVSLHKTGSWHVRIGESEAISLGFDPDELKGPTWQRPEELAQGVTLAFRIVVPPAAILRTHAISKADQCVIIPPPSPGKSVEVSFVITCAPPRQDSWVGRDSMNTSLVGARQMTEGEWLTVVWREIDTPALDGTPLPAAGAKRLTSELSSHGGIGVFLWALDGDGVPWLLLGKFDDESVVRFRENWPGIIGTPSSA